MRLCSLRRFGYLIASLSQSQANMGGSRFFEYDSRRALFEAHEVISTTKMEEISSVSKPTEGMNLLQANLRDDRKLQLMKSMAQLRLEVNIVQLI